MTNLFMERCFVSQKMPIILYKFLWIEEHILQHKECNKSSVHFLYHKISVTCTNQQNPLKLCQKQKMKVNIKRTNQKPLEAISQLEWHWQFIFPPYTGGPKVFVVHDSFWARNAQTLKFSKISSKLDSFKTFHTSIIALFSTKFWWTICYFYQYHTAFLIGK